MSQAGGGHVSGLVRFCCIAPLRARSGFLLTYGRVGRAPLIDSLRLLLKLEL